MTSCRYHPSPIFDVRRGRAVPTFRARTLSELLQAHPSCTAIWSRDVDSWWESARARHVHARLPSAANVRLRPPPRARGVAATRPGPIIISRCFAQLRLRSTIALEYLYKKKYLSTTSACKAMFARPAAVQGSDHRDGWEKLCGFSGVPAPDMPFPHKHRDCSHRNKLASGA